MGVIYHRHYAVGGQPAGQVLRPLLYRSRAFIICASWAFLGEK